ncbi:hypothetical protein HW260_10390 [Helicobacter cinaedi]|nr:hypothetical protein [Helicobacter cinaedi]QOQ90605.1 hypothetical protein HW260_10390 [Helicobacter cinaedi]
MAAGNEGKMTPAATAVAPSYDEAVRAWLVAGALDAQGITIDEKTKHMTILSGKCSSNNQAECNGLASFSNAFKGAALYAITAPGSQIDSANANFGTGQSPTSCCQDKNGTSTDEFLCDEWDITSYAYGKRRGNARAAEIWLFRRIATCRCATHHSKQ